MVVDATFASPVLLQPLKVKEQKGRRKKAFSLLEFSSKSHYIPALLLFICSFVIVGSRCCNALHHKVP